MIEHRLFTRYPVIGKAVLQTKTVPIRTVRGDMIDISFKGIGIYSDDAVQPNEAIRVLLTSKSFERHIQGEGKIKYVQSVLRNDKRVFRMGIEFVNVDSDLVRDIVETLQKESLKKTLRHS
jgi:c-di-GMP-binding flagellar brake protein YcgR